VSAAAPTVLLWSPLPAQAARVHEALSALVEVRTIRAADEADAIVRLAHADAAVFVGAGSGYTAAIAQAARAAPRLRWIQFISTGIEGLETHGAPPGVVLSGIGDAGAAAVAEHAMALLLALVRRLAPMVLATQEGRWDRGVATGMRSLEGLQLGLVGCGGIGQATARRAQAFGMRCVGINRGGANPAPALFERVLPLARRDEALAGCEALVISLPLTPETRGVLAAPAWRACRRGVVVVNVGRGATIDTASLVAALDEGHASGAGLDVTDPEPLPPGHPLWGRPDVVVSPHVAGGGSAAVTKRVCELVAENARRFARGEPPRCPLAIPTP